jgi:enoyl-CoA hydratase
VIDVEVRGRTALVTINRPEARNAVDGSVASGLESAVDRIEADDDVWSAVLTGAGSVFCAGADLKVIAAGKDREMFTERGNFGGFVRRERTKPFIAAVNGPALAGGCELALACDLIVADETARFGLPEVKRSLVAAAGGLVRLPRLLPPQVAMRMLLTGDPIDAETALRHGLVVEVVPAGQAVEAALALAARIDENAPLAVRATLRLARSSADTDPVDVWKASRRAMNELATTDDYREGPRAFIEKRSPRWSGR